MALFSFHIKRVPLNSSGEPTKMDYASYCRYDRVMRICGIPILSWTVKDITVL